LAGVAGWNAVCVLGAGCGSLALSLALYERLRPVVTQRAARREAVAPPAISG